MTLRARLQRAPLPGYFALTFWLPGGMTDLQLIHAHPEIKSAQQARGFAATSVICVEKHQ